MSSLLDRHGALANPSGMGNRARLLFVLLLAWSVVFVPFVHSTALASHIIPSEHQHDGLAHSHDHSDATHEHSCHHEGDESEAPASTDPCSMCTSHPMCHMVVLLTAFLELPAPAPGTFELAAYPTAAYRSQKPPLGVPRS